MTLVNHRCEYLLQEKGQEFVHQIQARFPRLFEQVFKKQHFYFSTVICLAKNNFICLFLKKLLRNGDNNSREFMDPPGELRNILFIKH